MKPQNVLLSRDGEVKVTDFGIARSLDAESGLTADRHRARHEQLPLAGAGEGLRVDAAADVYSLGVVLYELLAGEVPFPGGNQVVVAMKHINEPPPSLLDRGPTCRRALDAAVARALQKDPERAVRVDGRLRGGARACLAEARVGRTRSGRWSSAPPPRR